MPKQVCKLRSVCSCLCCTRGAARSFSFHRHRTSRQFQACLKFCNHHISSYHVYNLYIYIIRYNIHIEIYVIIHTHTHNIYIYIYTYVHTHTHTHNIYIYVCVHVASYNIIIWGADSFHEQGAGEAWFQDWGPAGEAGHMRIYTVAKLTLTPKWHKWDKVIPENSKVHLAKIFYARLDQCLIFWRFDCVEPIPWNSVVLWIYHESQPKAWAWV